jgi:hypothetical protein
LLDKGRKVINKIGPDDRNIFHTELKKEKRGEESPS